MKGNFSVVLCKKKESNMGFCCRWAFPTPIYNRTPYQILISLDIASDPENPLLLLAVKVPEKGVGEDKNKHTHISVLCREEA